MSRWTKELEEQLRSSGIEVLEIIRKNHTKFRCRLPNGNERTFVAAATPSDFRARKNFNSDVRKALRH